MELEQRVKIFTTLDRYRNQELGDEEESFVKLKLKNDVVWQEEWTYLLMIDAELKQGNTDEYRRKIQRWKNKQEFDSDDDARQGQGLP